MGIRFNPATLFIYFQITVKFMPILNLRFLILLPQTKQARGSLNAYWTKKFHLVRFNPVQGSSPGRCLPPPASRLDAYLAPGAVGPTGNARGFQSSPIRPAVLGPARPVAPGPARPLSQFAPTFPSMARHAEPRHRVAAAARRRRTPPPHAAEPSTWPPRTRRAS